MSKLYARTDMHEIVLSQTGHRHTAKPGKRLIVDCDPCAPHLVKMTGTFSSNKFDEALLTPDEIATRSREEKEGSALAQQMARQFGDVAAREIAKVRAKEGKTAVASDEDD